MRATALALLAIGLAKPVDAQPVDGVLVVGSVTPNPAQLGGPVSFGYSILNESGSDVSNVVLTDMLPSGVTLVSATVNGGPGCTGTTALSCDLGTMADGHGTSVVITARAHQLGSLSDSASVTTAVNSDPIVKSVDTTVVAGGDIAVAVDAPASVSAGAQLTTTITVSNVGAVSAYDVTLTDELPAGATLISATSSAGSCNTGSTVSCRLFDFAVGASVSVTLTLTADRDFTNSVTVGSDNDANPGNNTASAHTGVTGSSVSDLEVVLTASPDPAGVGEPVTFTLTVVNVFGPAAPAAPTFTVPDGTPLDPPPAGCSGTPLTCDAGSLGPGGIKTFMIVARPAVTGLLTGTATLTASDENPVNNSATASVDVAPAFGADVEIAGWDASFGPMAGADGSVASDSIVTIRNNGPDVAAKVIVEATIFIAGSTVRPIVSFQDPCSQSDALVTCTWTNVPAGGIEVFGLAVTGTPGAVLHLDLAVHLDSQDDPVSSNDTQSMALTYPVRPVPPPMNHDGCSNITHARGNPPALLVVFLLLALTRGRRSGRP